MNQFKYHYWKNHCWFNQQLIDKSFTTQFNGLGFTLENDWIVFTIYESKIRAFYKKTQTNNQVLYYRKELPKQEITEWEFTEQDLVEKIDGKWQKKN